MANQEKTAAVAEINEQFTNSTAAVLTEYRGLTVGKMSDLRTALGSDATYSVVKNTLTRIAAKEAGLEIADDLLQGPTAVVFIRGDIATAAKGLRDFAKDNPLLVIKGGVLEGKTISVDQVKAIAELESREVLLAKLAGAMKGNMSKAAAVFIALPSQLARLAEALKEKKPADAAPAAEAAAEAPADAPAEAPAEASDSAAETAEG